MRTPVVLVAALAAVLPGPGGAALAETWHEESHKTVEAGRIRLVEIHNARGRIELLPSPDGRIHVTAVKTARGRSRERARRLAEDVVVETDTRGTTFRLDVRYPRRHGVRINLFDATSLRPRTEVHVTARVPAGIAALARTASGDVRSQGLRGSQTLRSVSGDIEIADAAGPVHASTTSGSVTAGGLVRAKVSSVSGRLRLERIQRGLDASTTSGTIRVSGARDSVTLASVSGSIRLNLDPGARCALDLRTTSGSLDVELPMEMHRATRRGVSGRIRGGTTPVSLRSVSGDITVSGGS